MCSFSKVYICCIIIQHLSVLTDFRDPNSAGTTIHIGFIGNSLDRYAGQNNPVIFTTFLVLGLQVVHLEKTVLSPLHYVKVYGHCMPTCNFITHYYLFLKNNVFCPNKVRCFLETSYYFFAFHVCFVRGFITKFII